MLEELIVFDGLRRAVFCRERPEPDPDEIADVESEGIEDEEPSENTGDGVDNLEDGVR